MCTCFKQPSKITVNASAVFPRYDAHVKNCSICKPRLERLESLLTLLKEVVAPLTLALAAAMLAAFVGIPLMKEKGQLLGTM